MKRMLLLFCGILGFLIFPFLEWKNPENEKTNVVYLTIFCKSQNAEICEKMAVRKIESILTETKGFKNITVDITDDFAFFKIDLKNKISKSDFALEVNPKIRQHWQELKEYIHFPDWKLDQSVTAIQYQSKIQSLIHYIKDKDSEYPILNADGISLHYLNGILAEIIKINRPIFHESFWILFFLGFLYPKINFLYVHFGMLGLTLFNAWLFQCTITPLNILTILLIQIWGLYSFLKNSGFWWSEVIFFFLILTSNPGKDWIIIYGIQLLGFSLLKWNQISPDLKKLRKTHPLVIIPFSFCTWPPMYNLEKKEINNDLIIQFGKSTPRFLVDDLHNSLLPVDKIKNIEKINDQLIQMDFEEEPILTNYPRNLRNEIEKWLNRFSGFEYAIYGFGQDQIHNQEIKHHNLSLELLGYDYHQLKLKAFELAAKIKENPRVSDIVVSSDILPYQVTSSTKLTGFLSSKFRDNYHSITNHLSQFGQQETLTEHEEEKILLTIKTCDNNGYYSWNHIPENEKTLEGIEFIEKIGTSNEIHLRKINQKFLLNIQFNFLGGQIQAQQFKKNILQQPPTFSSFPLKKEFSITEKAWGLLLIAFLLNFGFSVNVWSSLLGAIPLFGSLLAFHLNSEISPETFYFSFFIGFAFASTLVSSGNIPPILVILIGVLGTFFIEFVPLFFQLLVAKTFYPIVFKSGEA